MVILLIIVLGFVAYFVGMGLLTMIIGAAGVAKLIAKFTGKK